MKEEDEIIDENKVVCFGFALNKTLTNIFFTVVATVCSALISKFESVIATGVCICITVLVIILQGLFSRHCITYDKEKRREIAEIARKDKIYKKLFEELPTLLKDQAIELNKIAKNIQEKGIIPGDRWTFDEATNYICESIMFFLKQFCKMNDVINVYYVKRTDDEKKVKMVGCANDLGEAPSIFGKERSIINSKTAYYDIKMFEVRAAKTGLSLFSTGCANSL